MKQLPYRHARADSLVVALWHAVSGLVSRRLSPALSRRLPGPAGRRLTANILLAVSLIVQIVLVATLAELVELSIALMELWTELARKHLEITL